MLIFIAAMNCYLKSIRDNLISGISMNPKNKARKQLLSELAALRNKVARLQESAKEFRRFKRFSQQQTHDLGERVKELNCL